jgi:hypothetical protein
VGAPANENLSGPQKELLEWHWKLGIGMYCIRSLMCEQHYDKPDGKTTILPAKILASVSYGSKLCCSNLSIMSPSKSMKAFPKGFVDAGP